MDDIALKLKAIKLDREIARARREETLKSSPLVLLKTSYKNLVEKSENYRVSILRKVATFADLNDEYLLSAAQNMEERIVPKGTVIIQQDDIGDSFYVIEEGEVSVTRKANVSDPTETPQLLAHLGANAFMGEISLLTSEPRTATITVTSPQAKILVMTKAKFDGVMQVVSAHLFSDKKEIGREVVNKVPLFASLSSSKKKAILNSMRPMNFMPNTYICRQGSSGNTFYIIADGSCRVTVNTGKGTEKEVTKLGVGDFFGEVALIEPSNKRTANVISISGVSCMTLSRQDFTQLLSNVRNTLIENSAVRTLALRKVKKDNKAGKGHIGKRRVTVMDEHNQKNAVLIPGMLRLMLKSMTESLYLSLYSRLYREMVLKPDMVEQYGDIARSVAVMHSHRDGAVTAIAEHARTIGKIDPNDRTAADNSFMYAILMQKNKLRDKICKGWPLYQYRLLCRQIRVIRVKPLMKVVEAGTNGTSAYVILRGSVRVFSQYHAEGSSKASLKYEEDLYPGDCFAESALDGIRNRLTTVQAMTSCDLAVVECQDYTTAAIENNQKESVDDRFQFLSRAAMFRHWDGVEMYRVASVMVREDFTKGTVLIRKGDISKKLSFLMEGKIDVVVGLNHQQIQHVITTIKQNECFNESGILTDMAAQKANSGQKVDRSESFAERCYAVAGSHVTLLSLPESHYNVIDQASLEKLLAAFRDKNIWRVSRLDNLRTESRNIHKWKKKVALERQMKELKWIPPPRPKQIEKEVRIQSLDDIPCLLDPDIDPMLAISTCKNSREVRAVQQAVRESYRPKSARVASVRKYLVGASSSIRHSGPKRAFYAFPVSGEDGQHEPRGSSAPDSHTQSLPLLDVHSPRGHAIKSPDPDRALLTSPNKHLLGSSHIPSAMSFCDTMPSESFQLFGNATSKKK